MPLNYYMIWRMQHRANPIPDTITKIVGFPRALTLYKIPASQSWWCRAFVDNRMYKKSTETPDKQQAIVFAKKWYLELKNKELQQLPLTETQSHVFEKVCLSLLKEDQGRADRHEVSQRMVQDQRFVMQKDVIPFFRSITFKEISYKKISEYLETLKDRNLLRRFPEVVLPCSQELDRSNFRE